MNRIACLAALRKTLRFRGRVFPERGWGVANRAEKRAGALGPILFGVCFSLFAWQSLPGAEIERVAVENNDLGISSIEIENRFRMATVCSSFAVSTRAARRSRSPLCAPPGRARLPSSA